VKRAGQIVLTPFPYTDLSGAKLRPVLLLRRASARFDDWLVCMVSSRLEQADSNLDETLGTTDPDFADSGLKVPSVLRLSRLAVLSGPLLAGYIGTIGDERLRTIRKRLARWIAEDSEPEK
jgi:mRNA interferase MazF